MIYEHFVLNILQVPSPSLYPLFDSTVYIFFFMLPLSGSILLYTQVLQISVYI